MKILIIGCGYVGLPLGKLAVAKGHEVFGVNRSGQRHAELSAAGIKPLQADITEPQQLQLLPSGFDAAFSLVSSSRGGVEEYRNIFLKGSEEVTRWLRETSPALKKFVFASSSSVYGQTDGSAVKESSPTEPASDTAQILREAEKFLFEQHRAHGFPAIIARIAGIYGPGRGHLFQQYLKNEARLYGTGDRLLNMIHLEDVAGALWAAQQNGRAGEIYNLVDDEPVAEIHFFRWLSETIGKNMPPFSSDSAPPGKRARTQKKVQNRRLKMELGYAFRYPTFRQGYTAEVKRLDDAGLLDFDPEPR